MFWALIIENVVRFFNTVLEALAVEHLSKLGQILPVFDENTLLEWSPTSTPYEIDWKLWFQFGEDPNFFQQSKSHKRRLETLLNNWQR